ncbi:Protein MIZU-KUSSEI 1 [Linum grandiflorum]
MFCNGRKTGFGLRREATAEDLQVMQTLHVISMGAGVIPEGDGGGGDGEMAYMRAHFERVVGSRDSETYYMMNPDGNSGPELSIFFVRV